jgi:hypothetical protein
MRRKPRGGGVTARDFYDRARALGITLSQRGESLILAPAERVTPEMVEQARELKPQLLAMVGNVVDFAAARRRLIEAGCLSVRRPGRVTTSRGPGRLLSLVAQRADHATVVLDAEPAHAVEVPVVEVEPLDHREQA